MSHEATFDPALIDEKDWVRQLIGDTDTGDAALSDAQVQAFVDEQASIHGDGPWVKYLAAAQAGESVMAGWQTAGDGVVEKQVGSLRLRRQEGVTAETTYGNYLRRLRSQGAELALRASSRAGRAPSVFRVL